jgi:Leucine-rich repeat (LRR) protein
MHISCSHFFTAWNNLEGFDVPDELAHLERLEKFHIYSNKGVKSAQFPPVFRRMTNLKSLALQHASLAGTIPEWISELTQLTSLALGDNKFHGTVSSDLKKLTKLRLLGLDDNDNLHGNINEITSGMKSIQFLYLQGNFFDGSVDHMLLDNMPNLIELDISSNIIDGLAPNKLLAHKNLVVADLHNNLLSGTFPNDFLENTKLEYLALNNNDIGGTITDRVAFLKRLKHFDVSHNRLTGIIPDTVAEMINLVYLNTAVNNFSSQQIPDLSQLTELLDFSMKSNNLTGSIPDWIGTLRNLRLLDLDANDLDGVIPESIGSLQYLNFLLLNRNQISGAIPSSMASLTKLQVLLLDGNDITGHANAICQSHFEGLRHFTADCYPTPSGDGPEVSCPCCTTCCVDGDENCNDKNWSSNYDPEWEYGFVRPAYHFSLDNAPVIYSKKNVENHPNDVIDDPIP